MIDSTQFRAAIEQIAEYETNLLSRFRVRRALRNERVFWRWQTLTEDRMFAMDNVLYGTLSEDITFDFQDLLDWLMENWDEILKILLTIIPFFI